MITCSIVGGGTLLTKPPKDFFIIGTNLHYLTANIIVAIDDNILDKLLKDNQGHEHQLVFTTPYRYEQYNNFKRCIPFDYDRFYNTNSLSSGLLAIALANTLGFDNIQLYGFTHLLDKNHHHFKKLQNLGISNKICIM
jgi:hypothetical protein